MHFMIAVSLEMSDEPIIYVHTTCLNLSEALSGHYPFELSNRLHSLRSFSLGLRRVYLSEAVNTSLRPLRLCERKKTSKSSLGESKRPSPM